ncbi:MAG: hypothetical protein K0U10_05580 [Gammaproteobacteria bacterium]|nr:hypothetical protein [Gammaproteobacteria bacterium]
MPYLAYSPDDIIAFKTQTLNIETTASIAHYLDNRQTASRPAYAEALYDITLSQLIFKAGFDLTRYPENIHAAEQQHLEHAAERLTIHFLKRKLMRIAQPEQLLFKPGSEILDPHHHLNSIYVKDNPDLLNLLPDFNAIYRALRDDPGIIRDRKREDELREQEGILTDTQFLGRSPMGGTRHPRTHEQRLNETVGYVRGPYANSALKEGPISNFASRNNNVCRCCDMCGLETKDTGRDLARYINHTIRHQADIIRVHIGETSIPHHGKQNVKTLFALLDAKRKSSEIRDQIIRLGHGTHMGIQSMTEAAQHGYYVEACLSSNKETGIIGKRKHYPLGPMLLLGVKVMIGTDGGDLYHTDLKKEYAYARKNINHFMHAIHTGHNEAVSLPNGDLLQYKQVKALFESIPQSNHWDDNKVIHYADLKHVEERCQQRINMAMLVDNMNEFKDIMFSEHANQAALVTHTAAFFSHKEKAPSAAPSEQKPSFLAVIANATSSLLTAGINFLSAIVSKIIALLTALITSFTATDSIPLTP